MELLKPDSEYLSIWNSLHQMTTYLGADYRNNFMADYCELMIMVGKATYYKGDEIMTDRQFDWFENRLKVLRPGSKILIKVG